MGKSSRVHIWGLAAIVALHCLCGSIVADDDFEPVRDDRQVEFGFMGGVFLPDRDVSGKPQKFDEIETLGGVRVGVLLSRHWGWFLDGTYADMNTNTAAGDVRILTARTGAEFFFRPHWERHQWFIALGAGLTTYRLEAPLLPVTDDSFRRSIASLSFGQRYALDDRARLRWELRGNTSLSDEGFGEKDIATIQALVGVSWRLGRIRADADGDGVQDRDDACPDTPRGAIVDARGCPKDSDGDGVYDGIDQCPDTPRGAVVDARGCPKDSDGDGVYDGIDRCPDTPRGATVDARGCPKDSDGDGVYDGIDQCPDTPRGAVVDARGCPKDSDGDGVYDGIDRCPGTPRGTPVGADGCPKAVRLFEPGKTVLVLEGVFFDTDKADLKPESAQTLDRVARSLRDWPEVRVEIGGHTDSTGSDEHNLRLSLRRAQAVRDYLMRKGVPVERLQVEGYGEGSPIDDNKTREGRSRNRRVELKKLK